MTGTPAPKELAESSALIVGGTAGIGLASAQALATAGVPRIAIVGRSAERGEQAATSILALGAETHFLAGDAVDPTAAAKVEDLFRSIVVVRGGSPMPPRDLIPLKMPATPGSA